MDKHIVINSNDEDSLRAKEYLLGVHKAHCHSGYLSGVSSGSYVITFTERPSQLVNNLLKKTLSKFPALKGHIFIKKEEEQRPIRSRYASRVNQFLSGSGDW